MRSIARACLLLAALGGSAHAMGSDVTIDLLAWNTDGSAALLRRSSTHEGDRQTSYLIVAATGEPLRFDPSALMHEGPGKDTEQITAAACTRAAKDLQAALASHSFHDVTVRADRCKVAARDIVAVGAGAARDAELSWISLPQNRTPSRREQAALAALATVDPKYQPVAPAAGCDRQFEGIDVAVRDERKLILVVTANHCDTPMKTRVLPLVPTQHGFDKRPQAD